MDKLFRYGQLCHGRFGVAKYALTALTEGVFWCANEPFYLLYRADSEGDFDYYQPCDSMDDDDTTEAIDSQDLEPDITDADCSLYLSFEGEDADTGVEDFSLSKHAVTEAGSFALDSSQQCFGLHSGYFTTNADTLTVGDHADFNFADGEFTISMRIRFESMPADEIFFYRQYDDATHCVTLSYKYSTRTLAANIINGANSVTLSNAAMTLAIDTWHHIAIVRYDHFPADVWMLLLDGNMRDGTTKDMTAPDLAGDVVVNYGGKHRGWIDDLYVLKGSATWNTDPYDVPTAAFGATPKNNWQYVRRGVSATGQLGTASPAALARVEASGALYHAVGNEPTGLIALNNSAGKIKLIWEYDPTDEPATPTGFKIYLYTGGAWVLQATQSYSAGRRQGLHNWTSGENAHDTELQYKVVAYRTVSGVSYLSDGITVTATADAEGPAAITTISTT
ncbi:MAG: hypothetical protein JRL30_25705 [Deltaproteobacteria bacterium]|nr:hypothetical protein [Deltaproteobacteria bacterium]